MQGLFHPQTHVGKVQGLFSPPLAPFLAGAVLHLQLASIPTLHRTH